MAISSRNIHILGPMYNCDSPASKSAMAPSKDAAYHLQLFCFLWTSKQEQIAAWVNCSRSRQMAISEIFRDGDLCTTVTAPMSNSAMAPSKDAAYHLEMIF